MLVAEKHYAKNPPHIIIEIRIIKIHLPTTARRRKTAEHQDFGVFGEKLATNKS